MTAAQMYALAEQRNPNDSIMSNAQNVFGKRYAMVPVTEIELDFSYQRRPSAASVRKLAQKWSEARYDPCKVVYRNGKFFCFDGGHRLAAQIMNGKNEVVCEICDEGGIEDEIRRFVTQNECTVKLNPTDTFKGNLLLGDEIDTAIDRVLKRYKIEVGNTTSAGKFAAITAARRIVKTNGESCFDWIMNILSISGWLVMKNGMNKIILRALADVWKKNEEKVPEVSSELIYKFRTDPQYTPSTLMAKAKAELPYASTAEAVTLYLEKLLNGKQF